MKARGHRLNVMGIGYTLFLYVVFSIADVFHFSDPTIPLTVRVVTLSIATIFFLFLRSDRWVRYQDTLVMIIAGVLVSGLVTVIWLSSLLAESYYFGLMQGAVLFGFVFRITFYRTLAVFILAFLAFAFAVSGKADSEAAFLQVLTLASIFAVCSFGAYFLEKLHRIDYVKARIIETQNAELSKMLELVQGDNQRKLAAMNILVHFVRTPIHQISGFTDLLMNSLKVATENEGVEQAAFLENAQYIKNASQELTENVTQLLEYHRLDDLEGKATVEEFHVSTELLERLDVFDDKKIELRIPKELTFSTINDAAKVAIKILAEQIQSHIDRGESVTVEVVQKNDGIEINFFDDGPAVLQEDFEYLVCPITKIENYLTYGGSSIPMKLRTLARAVEICGGVVQYQSNGQNKLTIQFPSLKDKQNTEAQMVA